MADSPYFDSTYFDSTYFDTAAAAAQPSRGGNRSDWFEMPPQAVPTKELVDEDAEFILLM